ncbi:hypothetical protein [Streptomyces litchfieldiae]|uniref:MbtH domain protein n=1 Tax=Streptomyces litchfieldiae TaxID=3075543 RepID=A0ABU2MRA1_9ACTN|nr:hypothetical protein [Streptomyces sp. DSM 44938]MDT0343932.1 hypothetical protein [Streptomyces sp. DSM 44938]
MSDLVRRLADADSEVDLGDRTGPLTDLRRRIEDLRYLTIRFTGTRGGTVLGVALDPAATRLADADFARATGTVHIEGDLLLDHVPVRCVADIDLASRRGVGRLSVTGTGHEER